jgi:hypothetical protein
VHVPNVNWTNFLTCNIDIKYNRNSSCSFEWHVDGRAVRISTLCCYSSYFVPRIHNASLWKWLVPTANLRYGGLFSQPNKRFRLMNIRDTRIVLPVLIYSNHFIRIQPAVESLRYGLDSNRMLLKCEYLNLWQRLGEVICQRLLTIQSMKGFERGIEKSYFLPDCSSYILFAAISLNKKTKPSSSSSFIFSSLFFSRSWWSLSFIYFFLIFRKCVINYCHIFCNKKH